MQVYTFLINTNVLKRHELYKTSVEGEKKKFFIMFYFIYLHFTKNITFFKDAINVFRVTFLDQRFKIFNYSKRTPV